jgi:hypothetical protein
VELLYYYSNNYACYMGVSENSVPLNPMVLLIIIPIKWLFHWEYTLFSLVFSPAEVYPLDKSECGSPVAAGLPTEPM